VGGTLGLAWSRSHSREEALPNPSRRSTWSPSQYRRDRRPAGSGLLPRGQIRRRLKVRARPDSARRWPPRPPRCCRPTGSPRSASGSAQAPASGQFACQCSLGGKVAEENAIRSERRPRKVHGPRTEPF
jgi:hypothetical protein